MGVYCDGYNKYNKMLKRGIKINFRNIFYLIIPFFYSIPYNSTKLIIVFSFSVNFKLLPINCML